MSESNSTKKTPSTITPFIFHGLDIDWEGKDDAYADCPWCGKHKFAVNVESGKWKCWVCDSKGNIYGFLSKIHQDSSATEAEIAELMNDRKLLFPSTLRDWGFCKSITTSEWIVPGYGVEGKIINLYTYHNYPYKDRALWSTKDLNPGLFGVHLYDKNKPEVLFVEGIWNAMSLYEMLISTRETSTGYIRTSNESNSLYARYNIIAVPGANVWLPSWSNLLENKKVTLLYDSDHAKILCNSCKKSYSVVSYTECPLCKIKLEGKMILPVGNEGMKRIVNELCNSSSQPNEVHYICWGDEGYNTNLPSGFDVRDFITYSENEGPVNHTTRMGNLLALQGMISPIPTNWVGDGETKEGALARPGQIRIKPIECTSYEQLLNQFKKMIRVDDGVDRSISFCLSIITSTEITGDQLWGRLIGPPSCLDGDTPIYDPVDKTTKSVEDRWKEGNKFFVYTMKKDGDIGIAQALPPDQFQSEDMYEVKFQSGISITVTRGHRFYNGKDYVSLDTILNELQESSFYSLPSISGTDLLNSGTDLLKGQLTLTDSIVSVKKVGKNNYYDFCVPETKNYWACGVINHNSGKTTIVEILAAARQWVRIEGVITGFHSGFKSADGKDNSLISRLLNMTLIIKDGDVLLRAANLSVILSQMRDIYDRKSRSSYGNGVVNDYSNISMTSIICGTESLREMDTSDLGERYIDCVLADQVSEDAEYEMCMMGIDQAFKDTKTATSGSSEMKDNPDVFKCKQMAYGYIKWLKADTEVKTADIIVPPNNKLKIYQYGIFVAFMRTRQSSKNREKVQRELGVRLCKQFARMAAFQAVVLNRESVDDEVMRRLKHIALDTGRGRTLNIVKVLYNYGRSGAKRDNLWLECGEDEDEFLKYTMFLRKLGVIVAFRRSDEINPKIRLRLTDRVIKIYKDVMFDDEPEQEVVNIPEEDLPDPPEDE